MNMAEYGRVNNPNYALKLGESVDKAYGPNVAYSFVYPFVNKRDDTWVPGQAGTANLAGMGLTLAAGARGQIAIHLNHDYNFKLKWFKYSTYWYDSENSQYVWWEPIVGWQYDQGDYQTAIGTPLINSIRVSVSLIGTSANMLYGGENIDRYQNVNWAKLPVECSILQGYDYGIGQLYTPYLIAKSGVILFEIYNTHSVKTLTVTGMAYGVKIRL